MENPLRMALSWRKPQYLIQETDRIKDFQHIEKKLNNRVFFQRLERFRISHVYENCRPCQCVQRDLVFPLRILYDSFYQTQISGFLSVTSTATILHSFVIWELNCQLESAICRSVAEKVRDSKPLYYQALDRAETVGTLNNSRLQTFSFGSFSLR